VIAAELIREAEAEAARKNSRAIALALRRSCCGYRLDPAAFHEALAEYVGSKRKTWDWWKKEWPRSITSSFIKSYTWQERQKVKALWPCPDCVRLFNPTGRFRP
jgi:hypothetical protein